ncbi:hypothetical protein [Paenibacillus sp. ACRRY]|uniref:hypothetical protein n=1 Tax=Paenibacillus sp. ACRRY TaxID=2918208 RepID=UPI001EF67989|nr:hypothetical protein [Paenibacillus sp. ACRRY]
MYDDALDAQIHGWYQNVLTDKSRKVWPPRGIPYFSPSSANSDARGLYEKMRGAKRESSDRPAHQGRWVRIGTAIGDVIQRDILFAEKHYARYYGENPSFSFDRNERGEPVFEDFAKRGHIVNHNGQTFALYGTCDGIMNVYVPELGRTVRVGLEIKSKQGTYSATSGYSMRNGAKEDHVKQCVCYSIMYDVDYYVILYVNASKKAWGMPDADIEKYPDIAAFGLHITEAMRGEILDDFAEIIENAAEGNAPLPDLDKWTFNDFKRTIALSLTEGELELLQRKVSALMRSSLPDWKKRGPAEALADIERIRAESQTKEAA